MITEQEQRQRDLIWEDEKTVGFHSIYHDELVLSVENCGKFPNGNWVRVLEVDLQTSENTEIGRVFWHRHSSLSDLENLMKVMADCRFPIAPGEPVDPEEPAEQ